MHISVSKTFKAKYKDKIVYLIPALGLWIIFLVWMLFRTNTNTSQLVQQAQSVNYREAEQSKEIDIDINESKNSTIEDGYSKLKVMTWNLQGLNSKELKKRTKAVMQVIESETPDVIFFQELISSTYNHITTSLQQSYGNAIGTEKSYGSYFTGIFYRTSKFTLEDRQIIPFSNTPMGRTQLVVRLSLLGSRVIRLALLGSHLESQPSSTVARIEQLKQCFETCSNFPDYYNVIFSGDLNLEENEEEGSIPDNFKDLWVESGSPEATKYTWDSTQNHNERIWNADQQPRVRYDRMYFRNSKPPTLKLEKFELLGKQLVTGTSYFPSDHWAIMSTFAIL